MSEPLRVLFLWVFLFVLHFPGIWRLGGLHLECLPPQTWVVYSSLCIFVLENATGILKYPFWTSSVIGILYVDFWRHSKFRTVAIILYIFLFVLCVFKPLRIVLPIFSYTVCIYLAYLKFPKVSTWINMWIYTIYVLSVFCLLVAMLSIVSIVLGRIITNVPVPISWFS